MISRDSARKPNIVICGCCRNCEPTLPQILSELTEVSRLANRVAWIFCENDSIDKTREILQNFKNSQGNIQLCCVDNLVARLPLRTERLALMRNMYLEAIRQDSKQDWDILMVVDMDNVNACPMPIDAIKESIELICSNRYAALFANAQPIYYDIWALRHPEWCPSDCWREVRAHAASDKKSAVHKFVKSRQVHVAPSADFIEVDSAFGGIGLYNMSLALQSIYIGLDEQGDETCEHVAFNRRVQSLSKLPLAINPKLVNTSPIDQIVNNTRFITFEHRGGKIFLECTLDHKLDSYMASHPLYDRRLPLLAAQLNGQGSDAHIVDIGANVGDTALLMRLASCELPIIAIEASEMFFSLMSRNVQRYAGLYADIQLIHAFVDCGQGDLPLIHHDGTAQLSTSSVAGGMHAQAPRKSIRLSELGRQKIALLKIDTDGFDAAIINENSDFFDQQQPILWLEADCNSDDQLAAWHQAIGTLDQYYSYGVFFDNFGFAIGAGALGERRAMILDLIAYAYRHKHLPGGQFGNPRFYYMDICLFPSSMAGEYYEFVANLPELGSEYKEMVE